MVKAVKQLCSRAGQSWTSRTWKREVATILLIVWCVSYLRCTVFPPSIEYMTASSGPLGLGTAAIFSFAIAAFGLDMVIKQMPGLLPGTAAPVPQVPTTAGGPVLR